MRAHFKGDLNLRYIHGGWRNAHQVKLTKKHVLRRLRIVASQYQDAALGLIVSDSGEDLLSGCWTALRFVNKREHAVLEAQPVPHVLHSERRARVRQPPAFGVALVRRHVLGRVVGVVRRDAFERQVGSELLHRSHLFLGRQRRPLVRDVVGGVPVGWSGRLTGCVWARANGSRWEHGLLVHALVGAHQRRGLRQQNHVQLLGNLLWHGESLSLIVAHVGGVVGKWV
mmetsp:Transcript_19373/g.37098  ORF Transcript_19373/g.37098 Transcript_19373/m.37098 type:complete len:227 (+) Transcript_19373:1219-1899(+)